jgi:hypothetical protein
MPNANRDKGLRFERAVANYYRAHGLLDAKRRVVTGWRTSSDNDPDLGDLKGVPGICTQAKDVVKSHPRGLSGNALVSVMAEAQAQANANGDAIALVVEKRAGHADVGECWVHMPGHILGALLFGIDPFTPPGMWSTFPVRIEMKHVIDSLVKFSQMCGKEAA